MQKGMQKGGMTKSLIKKYCIVLELVDLRLKLISGTENVDKLN